MTIKYQRRGNFSMVNVIVDDVTRFIAVESWSITGGWDLFTPDKHINVGRFRSLMDMETWIEEQDK